MKQLIINITGLIMLAALSGCGGGGGGGNDPTPVIVTDGTAKLSWIAPAERVDRSVLPYSEIGGYYIYSGTTPNNMALVHTITDRSVTKHTFSDLPNGKYYFSVSSFNIHSSEGGKSTKGEKSLG